MASCPERDVLRRPILEEAQEFMKSTGNLFVAGEADDRFFGQLSHDDNFFTGWKGKVDQVLMTLSMMLPGISVIFLTIKGGPVCDREREHLDTCSGVRSRVERVIHCDTLEEFKGYVASFQDIVERPV